MNYLTKQQIILINKLTVARHGGNYMPPENFLHEENLDYLMEIITSEMFGEPLYPSISDKAGLLMFNIISNHIFSDGNKRTGLEAGLLFVKMNGYTVRNESYDKIFNFTIQVASGELTLEQTQDWFLENIEKVA